MQTKSAREKFLENILYDTWIQTILRPSRKACEDDIIAQIDCPCTQPFRVFICFHTSANEILQFWLTSQ